MIENFINSGIIKPEDVSSLTEYARKHGQNIIFMDATFVLPTSEENILENYKETHLPDARFFDIEAISDKSTTLPHMLPSKKVFENSMQELGIKNNDIVILYGQDGMIMGPARVWWMMKGFGHKQTIVLDGGLPSWIKCGLETESGIKHFSESDYKSNEFDTSKIIDMENVLTVSDEKSAPIIDARPAGRFDGTTPEPRAAMRSGHIPNSINIPCSELVKSNGQFKDQNDIITLFKNKKIQINDLDNSKIITSCGSGITACALALALYHIGHTNTAVYDGSWSEWGRESSPTPVAMQNKNT